MVTFTKPVPLSLKLLFSHEQGELCNKIIPAAADKPVFSLVKKDGSAIDPSVADYDGTDAYGIHLANGQVYWANSVFSAKYIVWPESTTEPQKALVIAHLENKFLIIKEAA